MKDEAFHGAVRTLNIQYKKVFGYIPCIKNFSCSREEYLEALNKSVQEKREISCYVTPYEQGKTNGMEI